MPWPFCSKDRQFKPRVAPDTWIPVANAPSEKLLAGARMRAFVVWLLILPVRAYRLLLSPWLGHSCRYEPSCSAYAIEALEIHGPLRGLWLTIYRVVRCNPWGGCGCDPVPPAAEGKPPARLQKKA